MTTDRQSMGEKFIQWTSGWIPASVLLLFATALVMGQDRPVTAEPQSLPAAPVVMPALPSPTDQIPLESIRNIVDSVLPIPETIQISIGASFRTSPDNAHTTPTPFE